MTDTTKFTVQVLRHRPNAGTRVLEPWPVVTIAISHSGEVTLTGSASKAYGPMQQAFEATLKDFAAEAARNIERQLQLKTDAQL